MDVARGGQQRAPKIRGPMRKGPNVRLSAPRLSSRESGRTMYRSSLAVTGSLRSNPRQDLASRIILNPESGATKVIAAIGAMSGVRCVDRRA
jgi:hypothetical protein